MVMVRNREGWAMRSRRVVGKGGQMQVAAAGDGEEWSNLDGWAWTGWRQTSSGRSQQSNGAAAVCPLCYGRLTEHGRSDDMSGTDVACLLRARHHAGEGATHGQWQMGCRWGQWTLRGPRTQME